MKGNHNGVEETSIPMQVQYCRERVAQMGGQVVDVIEEPFVSAATLNRPGMKRIVTDLEAGVVSPSE